MFSILLAPTAHLAPVTGGPATAYGDVWLALLTVLAVIAIVCILLVVLTYLEPKTAIPTSPSKATEGLATSAHAAVRVG
ncbi:MAG: hypothetical protein WAV00_02800 [Nocardioides sp.]